jgi:hypothetical protein
VHGTARDSDWQQEADHDSLYAGKPVWEFDPKLKGYRAHFPTADEDFAQPYVDPSDYDII